MDPRDLGRKTLVLGALFAAISAGCGGGARSFEVLKQAPTSPIEASSDIGVRPPRVGEILVDGRPEQTLTAELTPQERARWNELLDLTRAAVLDGLQDNRGTLRLVPARPNRPAVEVVLRAVELAHHDLRGTPRLKVTAAVKVFDRAGTRADEVQISSVIEAEVTSAETLEETRERRFRRAGLALGAEAAAYLRERAGAE